MDWRALLVACAFGLTLWIVGTGLVYVAVQLVFWVIGGK